MTNIFTKNKDILTVVLVTAAILMIPLFAMRYTDEVVWDLFDFVFASVLIGGTGLLYVLVKRSTGNIAYRAAAGLALAATFLLIWINGAVRILGSEDEPANLLYFFVIAVEFLGALAAGFRPRGMTRVMFATAFATMLVPVIALIINTPDFSPGVAQAFGINAFFAMLFIGSGLVFKKALKA